MRPSTATRTGPTIDDPEVVAYWAHRKVVRRRVLVATLLGAGLATGLLGWFFTSHLLTTWWLEANQFVVLWSVDKENWKQGGSTTVRYSAAPHVIQKTMSANELKVLFHLRGLEELDLSTLTGLVDADLGDLGGMTTLRRLNLDRSHQPNWLMVDQVGLTDATIARIGRLSRIIELNLGGQRRVTDAGLAHLAGLDQLRSLDLVETGITDAGLAHLKTLPALKSLNLKGTKVTIEGVADFESSRPGVVVLSDPPPNSSRSKTPR